MAERKSRSILNENGHEMVDSKPMAIPAGFGRPETLAEQVQRLVRGSISREAEEAGFETFEESEDFDIEDDPLDPSTPYETVFDPVLGKDISPDEFRRNQARYRQQFRELGDEMTQSELFEALGVDKDTAYGGREESRSESQTESGAAGSAPSDGAGAPSRPEDN